MTDIVPSLASKLSRAAAACAHVTKEGRNDYHKYRYAKAEDVFEAVNAALAAQNVSVTVALDILAQSSDGKSREATVKARITYHDGDSDATLTTEGIGSGQDQGDKAVMKATTVALKYAYIGSLVISTGDDPEADSSTDRRNAGIPPQRAPVSRPSQPPAATPAGPPRAIGATVDVAPTPIRSDVDVEVEPSAAALVADADRAAAVTEYEHLSATVAEKTGKKTRALSDDMDADAIRARTREVRDKLNAWLSSQQQAVS